ncbi:MAG: hypothetical protein KDD41_11130, partial [Flavobacteriales bacterium]|nr:hypothetical protein [Flavobacteriales bacterium]
MEEETLNNKILSYALNVLTESEVPILKAFLKRMGLGTPESLMELISSGVDNIGIDIDENGADFLIPNALKIDLIKQLSSLEGKEASEEEVEVFKKFWNALIVVQCNFFPEDNDTKLKLYDYLIGMTSDLGQIFDSESAQKHIKYFQNKKNIIPVSYPQPEPSLSSITLLEFKGEKKLKKLK